MKCPKCSEVVLIEEDKDCWHCICGWIEFKGGTLKKTSDNNLGNYSLKHV